MRDALPVLLIIGALLLASRARAGAVNVDDYRSDYRVSGTVGQRNNNPLNIRFSPANNWLGQDASESGAFAYFTAKKYGYRAAFVLMNNYAKKYGANTIAKIVYRWAPPSDNNPTDLYIRFVADKTGIPSNEVLNVTDYPAIVRAMALFESKDNDPAALADGYALAFGGNNA